MSAELQQTLNVMTRELGKKVGSYWSAEFTVKEVLERLGKPNTAPEHNYVRHIVLRFYPGSTVAMGQGDNGGFIKIKIRSV